MCMHSLTRCSLKSVGDLLHAVLAQQPPSVSIVTPSIPPVVASVVAKLLCKRPEQRYKSCLGVHRDLKRCQAASEAHGGGIESFELGAEDVDILLKQPQCVILMKQTLMLTNSRQLYGRIDEMHAAARLYEQLHNKHRVCALFIAGEPGSGKSSFMKHFTSTLGDKALCARGRFEQVCRDVWGDIT